MIEHPPNDTYPDPATVQAALQVITQVVRMTGLPIPPGRMHVGVQPATQQSVEPVTPPIQVVVESERITVTGVKPIEYATIDVVKQVYAVKESVDEISAVVQAYNVPVVQPVEVIHAPPNYAPLTNGVVTTPNSLPDSPKEFVLDQLAQARQAELAAQERQRALANQARELGSTWADVAAAAHLSTSAAFTKFSEKGQTYDRTKKAQIRQAARGELPFEEPVKFEQPTNHIGPTVVQQVVETTQPLPQPVQVVQIVNTELFPHQPGHQVNVVVPVVNPIAPQDK